MHIIGTSTISTESDGTISNKAKQFSFTRVGFFGMQGRKHLTLVAPATVLSTGCAGPVPSVNLKCGCIIHVPHETRTPITWWPIPREPCRIIALVLNDTTITAVPGTVAIWRVDLSLGGPPVVNKAADVPDGMFLDGLSAVLGESDLVLGADTAAGRIWQINLRTGVVRIVAQDDAFGPDAPAPAFGINGLHVRDGDLYFTNSQKKTFSRFPISLRGGNVAQAGPVEVLGSANRTDHFDAFAFDSAGRVWAATLPDTLTVFFPPVQGNRMLGQFNAPGNPVEFNSLTSAMFGRGEVDRQHTLYMTTQAG
ncbi:hypothetical protein B0H16DRAFT_1770421 [Mycena metata]|uniref:SMP-30/Gluconolactonase/LRE-like region domain-containing protein n=1 Tax=Mycena metata TaxID=1033252 RepID=A0AAD7MTS7_9AGAR|nr:hypothetical protein B0H16DRAFT_1770421 [Mycena metata]